MVDYQRRDTRRGIQPDADSPGQDDATDDDQAGHDAHGKRSHHAHDVEQLGAAVVTVSSSRTLDNDPGGDALAAAFESAGHTIVTRELIGDDHDRVQSVVNALVGRDDVDLVVTTGGTGVTPDDVTVEAVDALFEKTLPGFGELFRQLSYEEIGPRTVATRATAGVADGVPVFCLPGSENAVRLGVEEVILPVAGHLAGLARRDRHDGE